MPSASQSLVGWASCSSSPSALAARPRCVSSPAQAVWFTCNTDLLVDARRDLDDIGATELPLASLTAQGYGDLSDALGDEHVGVRRQHLRIVPVHLARPRQ